MAFLLGVLGEEAVLIKEIVHHAGVHLLLLGAALLEGLQPRQQVVRCLLTLVHLQVKMTTPGASATMYTSNLEVQVCGQEKLFQQCMPPPSDAEAKIHRDLRYSWRLSRI